MNMHTPSTQTPNSGGDCWLDILTQLRRCHGVIRDSLNRFLQGSDLHETEFLLLWQLASNHEPLAQKLLAPRIGASPAQVSGLLERLRVAGLVVSERDSRDRRKLCWQATPPGHLFVQNVLQAGQLQTQHWNRTFPPAEQEALRTSLHLLDDALTNTPGPVHHASDKQEKAA